MTELSPILAELERMYAEVCKVYSLSTPEPPIITLASKGRKRTCMGWYNQAVWSNHNEDALLALTGVRPGDKDYVAPTKRAEIVIATELLGDPVQTVAELARQALVHRVVTSRLDQGFWPGKAIGAPPTNRIVGANAYYPEAWKNFASGVDCSAHIIPEQQSRGWAEFKPDTAFIKFVTDRLNYDVFEVSRKDEGMKAKVGSRMKKWSCGCTTVRCAIKLLATCEKCGHGFKWAEKGEPAPFGYPTDDTDLPPSAEAPFPDAQTTANLTAQTAAIAQGLLGFAP